LRDLGQWSASVAGARLHTTHTGCASRTPLRNLSLCLPPYPRVATLARCLSLPCTGHGLL